MIFIAHRGNIDGKKPWAENKSKYIDSAIKQGYDVEIDVWFISETFYLGHDEAQEYIGLDWLLERSDKLWVHCKNIDAVEEFKRLENEQNIKDINWFWHQNDDVTLTSHGYIWKYPGIPTIKNCIVVMPELNNDSLKDCIGVCSDNVQDFKR